MSKEIKVKFVIFPLFLTLFWNIFPSALGVDDKDVLSGQEINGKSREQWAQAYWQWLMTLPPEAEKEPANSNLKNCIAGSDSNNTMIFLHQIYGFEYSTKCEIPSGKPILVPLLISECDPTVPEKEAKSGKIEDLWKCAKDANEVFQSWSVILDNRTLFEKQGSTEVNMPLKNEILVRNSSLFTINVPENNYFDIEPGSYPAVVDGYYLVLKPLAPGEHSLTYTIVHNKATPPFETTSGKGNYLLTVR